MPRITEYYDVTVRYNYARESYHWYVMRGGSVVDYGTAWKKKRAFKKALRAVAKDREKKRLEFSETIRIPACDQ